MLRTMAYVATALVLIALVAAKQGWFGDADHTTRNETALPVIAPVPAGTITESATSSSTKPYGSNDATSVQSPASSSVLMRSSGPEFAKSVTTRQSNSNEAQISTAIDTDVDPTEVIGRPFPVSTSVESSCRSEGKLCNEILQLLSTMAQEPRDPVWASNTEAKLRALIMAEPSPFTIRAIECRTSLCAVEVASIFGQYFGHLDTDKSLDKSLERGYPTWGYEIDSSSARVTVTLYLFRRR